MNRKTFLKRAGVGTVAAASLPAALGTSAAFGGNLPPNGHRIGEFVSFSQAPAPALGLTQPRIGMNGAVTFDPHARWVKGGGGYELFDNALSVPKPLVLTGQWKAREFVGYDTKGLAACQASPATRTSPAGASLTLTSPTEPASAPAASGLT